MASSIQLEVPKEITTRVLTTADWPALEALFGPRGAVGGCWCMYWRLPRREYYAGSGEGNRQAFKALVEAGRPAGILAFNGDEPAGWAAVAPRSDYPALDRSRNLKPVDAEPVWSIPCFFIARKHRRMGIMKRLILAAENYARQNGATILEAYPVDPAGQPKLDASVYTGLASAFEKMGFSEAARRSPTRPVMRKRLG